MMNISRDSGGKSNHCRAAPGSKARRAADGICEQAEPEELHAPDHRLFNRFRAFELHGLHPRLGPIA